MKKRLFIVMIFFISTSSLFASGFASLKMGTDARTSAMGTAATALPLNASIGFWNPAGLSLLHQREFMLTANQWLFDVKSGFIGLGWGNGKRGVGFHLLYTDIPDIEYRIAPTDNPIGTFSSNEMIFGFSYAQMILQDLFLGVNLKGYFTRILYHEAWGIGSDIGLLWHMNDQINVGASIQNLGKTSRLNEYEVDLPVTVRTGAAYQIIKSDHNISLTVDGVKEVDSPLHLNAGVEYGWQNRFFIRAGYSAGYDESRSITGGIGVVQGVLRLNYGYLPFDSGLGDAHQLSLGVYF